MTNSNNKPFYDPTKRGKLEPIKTKKSSGKKKIAIIWVLGFAIILIIILILFYQFGVMNTEIDQKKFIGTWHIKTEIGGFIGFDMKFNSNKTLEMGEEGKTEIVGTWKLSNNKLKLSIYSPTFSIYNG